MGQLLILAGLRHLEGLVEQEVRTMPITEDIRNHSLSAASMSRVCSKVCMLEN